eukprot:jgi/Chrzof1/14939/Cz09g21150.t1
MESSTHPKQVIKATATMLPDSAGIHHPTGFFIHKKPSRSGQLPVGTSDIPSPDEHIDPTKNRLFNCPGGTTIGWGKRSDRRGSQRGNKKR